MNMKKTIRLIPLCVALFWACSDSPDVTGTTIIDNTVAQEESSSSEMQKPESSSNTTISGEDSSSSKQTPKISSSSQQPVSSSSVATSSASQPSSSSEGAQTPSPAFAKDTRNGFKLGSCISPGVKPLGVVQPAQTTDFGEVSFGESHKAYILNDGNGNYQVMVLNVVDYCDVDAELSTVRSGDTLEIKYGVIKNVTECTCNNDHWFDIKPEDKTAKFIRFSGAFSEVTYEVSDGPVPEPSKTTQSDTTSTQTSTQNDSTFTDPRDGKTYRTVKLGERIWMAENLNYEIKDSLVSNCDENGGCDMGFPTNRPQSWCNGNKQENCDKYGRLYNFEAAKVACPPGWSLPEVEEWPERGNGGFPAFLDYAVVGWGGGKDTYGFTVLPAGDYSARSQYFFEPGRFAYFWTSTIDTRNHNCATMIHFGNGSEGMVSVCADDENDGLSVRCLKD